MSRATATPERSRTVRARVRVLAAGGAAIGALLLAGCGAGQIAQTSQEVSAVTGDGAITGDIAVRNAEIPYPAGGAQNGVAFAKGASAPVALTIVNSGPQGDRLVLATSPAGSVVVTGDTSVPPQLPLVAGRNEALTTPLEGTRSIGVQITGLTEEIRPGMTYPLVLTFERAGQVTVNLPVGPPATQRTAEPAPAEGH